MNERLFEKLYTALSEGPVVLASVLETRGATPRKGGSRMLITGNGCHGSVGGGMAEARVIDAARLLLASNVPTAQLEIDLTGREGAAGVCGGVMRIGLRQWHGTEDLQRIRAITTQLRSGERVTLTEADTGGNAQPIDPDVRLLIIGAGHCGLALFDLASHLDFDIWVYDERAEAVAQFAGASQLTGEATSLLSALNTSREVFAVCLNRDFHTDVGVLRVLCQRPPHFLGMMGSGKRISEVMDALPDFADALANLNAPVGIDIDAQTPHEIAVSILAQLIRVRRSMGG